MNNAVECGQPGLDIQHGKVNHLRVAGLPENISPLGLRHFSEKNLLEGLTKEIQDAALFVCQLSDPSEGGEHRRYIVGLQKIRPYASYDLMLMVFSEGEIVGSVSDLTAEEFTKVLNVAMNVLETYDDYAKKTNDPKEAAVVETISFNYDEQVGTDHSVQSLPAFHVHVSRLTERENERIRSMTFLERFGLNEQEFPDKASKLAFYNHFQEELLSFAQCVLKNPVFRDKLTEHFDDGEKHDEGLTLNHRDDYEGINFSFPQKDVGNSVLARNIQTLVQNAKDSFTEIGTYVRRIKESGTPEQKQDILDEFADTYRPKGDDGRVLKFYRRTEAFLSRLAGHKTLDGSINRFAYTLSLIRRKGDDGWILSFADRGLSHGNCTTSLRLERKVNPDLSPRKDILHLLALKKYIKNNFYRRYKKNKGSNN